MVSLITPNVVIRRKKRHFKLYRCVLDIVTLSDFDHTPPEAEGDKVQVYISGTLHGDERIGP